MAFHRSYHRESRPALDDGCEDMFRSYAITAAAAHATGGQFYHEDDNDDDDDNNEPRNLTSRPLRDLASSSTSLMDGQRGEEKVRRNEVDDDGNDDECQPLDFSVKRTLPVSQNGKYSYWNKVT